MSLLEIVDRFECFRYSVFLSDLHTFENWFEHFRESHSSTEALEERLKHKIGRAVIPDELQTLLDTHQSIEDKILELSGPIIERCAGTLAEIEAYADASGFDNTRIVARTTRNRLSHGKPKPDVIAAELQHVREALTFDAARVTFLRVDSTLSPLVDNDALFGEAVWGAFPSARFDIRESGNCRAVGCSTAAVFHLMRAVEWGLRALCVDLGMRRVQTRNKKSGKVTYIALGWSDWETLLNQLRSRITETITSTKRGPRKQACQEFYYPAVQEIEGFKEAFRNHVMHTRREYSAADSAAVFDHVKRFMNKLATRVAEV